MDKTKIKIVLIHGNGGATGKDHWFPELKLTFEKEGFKVVAPDFPDNEVAHENVWLPFLKKEIGTDGNTIIVGHSSGAVAAMRYAENNKIYGSVLVGACYTDLGDSIEKESGYYNRPWDWEKIKNNQNWIVQFASTDDPYIPIEEARHIHEHLGSEYFEFNDKGHFLFKSCPEIVEVIINKLTANREPLR